MDGLQAALVASANNGEWLEVRASVAGEARHPQRRVAQCTTLTPPLPPPPPAKVVMDNPLHGFVKVHHTLRGGVYELSAEPGLGVELQMEELKPYKVDATMRNMAEVV